eukprot:g933.t1
MECIISNPLDGCIFSETNMKFSIEAKNLIPASTTNIQRGNNYLIRLDECPSSLDVQPYLSRLEKHSKEWGFLLDQVNEGISSLTLEQIETFVFKCWPEFVKHKWTKQKIDTTFGEYHYIFVAPQSFVIPMPTPLLAKPTSSLLQPTSLPSSSSSPYSSSIPSHSFHHFDNDGLIFKTLDSLLEYAFTKPILRSVLKDTFPILYKKIQCEKTMAPLQNLLLNKNNNKPLVLQSLIPGGQIPNRVIRVDKVGNNIIGYISSSV